MGDVKWLLRRCGLPILLLLIFVIAGVFCWGKLHAEKQKVMTASLFWLLPLICSLVGGGCALAVRIAERKGVEK